MFMVNNRTSTTTARKAARTKASTFPLFQRQDGRWCKKIGGRSVYFGRDKEAALEKYKRHVGLLAVGLDPAIDGLTVAEIFDQYLTNQRQRCEAGEIGARAVSDSASTLRRVTAVLGRERAVASLSSTDWATVKVRLSKGRCAVTLAGDIRRTRAAFAWALSLDVRLIDTPPRFGQFKAPPKRVGRLAKARRQTLTFEPAEVQTLIDAAEPQLKAMIYLGLNAALIPVDLARLELADFSADLGWLTLPRFKTGEPRKAWIWPETREAVKAAQAERPKPASDEFRELLLLTEHGNPVVRTTTPKKAERDARFELSRSVINRPTADFRELCKAGGLYRHGRGFGQLRHLFLTIAESGLDFVAVSKIMGHVVPGVTSHYRDHIGDDRIKTACEIVRAWLLGKTPKKRKPR